MSKIAFIGLGNMGGPMACNLLNADHQVCGFDLSEKAMQGHQQAGGEIASSASEVVKKSDVVISMLPAGKHVHELYLGNDKDAGLLARLPSNVLIIECSTIEASIAREVARAAEKRGIAFIDAPVSGGTAGAANGTLTFMVGGKAEALTTARPYLEAMGQNIFHAGEAGAGQLAKICNNMLLAICMTGTAEALKLGIDNGLDPKILSDIMKNSSGGNWVLEKYNPVPGVMDQAPASRDYQGGFMTALMLKDLALALGTASDSHSTTPMGALAENLYRLHRLQSGDQQDFSSVIRLYTEE